MVGGYKMETWEDYGTYIHFTTDNIRGLEWIKKKEIYRYLKGIMSTLEIKNKNKPQAVLWFLKHLCLIIELSSSSIQW